jgi:5-methyltetrahydrofolate--homocysteine methyltransferase
LAELQAIAENLIEGEANKVRELIQAALDSGIEAEDILNEGLIAGMGVIGEEFKKEEIYLPEVLFAARAMKAGMELLAPLLASAGHESIGRIVLGTVQGDVHDIGKNLVSIMLQGAGFEVIDLGTDTPPQSFVDAVKEHQAPLVGMSALVGTTIPFMKTTIEALEAAGLKGRVKTMIGGAIVTQDYADKIGADGYASDAATAVDEARRLLGLS